MTTAGFEGPAAAGVLGDAEHVTVCVLTKRGPHTTPELFTVTSGRLWCLTAASTLKAKLLADGGDVAVAASAGERSMIAVGSATVLDPTRPGPNLRQLGTSLAAPRAVGQFALDNAAELSGAVLDLFAGKLGSPVPPRRVVLCIEPRAVAVVDAAGEVVEADGWAGAAGARPDGRPADGDLDLIEGVPEQLRDLAGSGPAVLGWTTEEGAPLALPVAWSAESCSATVPRRLFDVAGAAARSPASVTRDKWTAFGPTGKQGLMLRGTGEASEHDGATVVALTVEGAAYWDGIETGRVTNEGA